ncbi:MAG: hydrogenase expression/formation protein HypE [Candidatus Thermoplasmatota archaeon]|nr:hydrogenase expression/formation protein HypE [Candidatus Thermoplasmatota archaeon]
MAKRMELPQGAGGSETASLIKKYIIPHFHQPDMEVSLLDFDDSAVVNGIAFTTDTHTVKPIFFPGGDIGKLAVAGTINDVAVMGARPIALSAGFVIEEGFSLDDFERIIKSMGDLSSEAGVPIVTGDTKVVECGAIQEIIINTAGIGVETEILKKNMHQVGRGKKWLQDSSLQPGDKILLSGKIADHGIAIISFRERYGFDTKIKSDVAPINGLTEECLKVGGIVAAKDPTRGGLSNALNEMAEKSGVGMMIDEERIPINEGTIAACEMLGIDPYAIGNEGKVIMGVVEEKADDVLKALRKHPLGKDAEIIGRVTDEKHVILGTSVGGKRILETPMGDPIPRIC